MLCYVILFYLILYHHALSYVMLCHVMLCVICVMCYRICYVPARSFKNSAASAP